MNKYPYLTLILSTLALSLSGCAPQLQTLPGGTEGTSLQAVTGKAIGDVDQKTEDEKTVKEQEAFMARQREELRRQQRDLEDIKRQQYHDNYYRSQYGNK